MDLLESDSARPRQARYQAALRPDMKYLIVSRILETINSIPKLRSNILSAFLAKT